jgi:hypothetical protein
MSVGNYASDVSPEGDPMTDATLDSFRRIADAMQTEPTDWQWLGPHASQRMFGISRTRAEAYAARHGGEARPMPRPRCERCGDVKPIGQSCDCFDNGCQ